MLKMPNQDAQEYFQSIGKWMRIHHWHRWDMGYFEYQFFVRMSILPVTEQEIRDEIKVLLNWKIVNVAIVNLPNGDHLVTVLVVES